MRRSLALVLVGLAILLVGLFAMPWLFADRLLERARAELDSYVDADVAFADAQVQVLRSFPDLTLVLREVQVHGRGEFQGRELLRISELAVTVDLVSVVSGSTLVIRAIEVGEGRVDLFTDASGRANTEILVDSGGSSASAGPDLELDRLVVASLDVVYADEKAGASAFVEGLSIAARASLSGSRSSTSGTIGAQAVTARSGGITLLNAVPLQVELDLQADSSTGRVDLGQSRVRLSQLQTVVAGSVQPVDGGTQLDLQLQAPDLDFKSLLSLVPAVYARDFAGLDASGTVSLAGSVAGILRDQRDELPGFELRLAVADGRFRYPDLPSAVDDVQVEAAVRHPGGSADLVEVDVPRFHLVMAGAPLDGRLSLRRLLSDPDLALVLKGKLDLEKLTEVVPADPGTRLLGIVEVDLDLAGRVSAFQGQDLDRVQAKGTIGMNGVRYQTAELPEEIVVERMQVQVDPRAFDMAELSLRFGRSDLRATGRLDNVLAYALTDVPLSGSLDVRSAMLDLGPYMNDDVDAPANPEDSSLVAVPSNLDLKVQATLGRVLTDTHDLSDVRGTLKVADGVIHLEGLRADTLGGQVELSGTYAAPTDRSADVDLEVTVRSMDIAELSRKVSTVTALVPVARTSKGRVSSTVSMRARLQPDLSPEIQSISSTGEVQALGVSVQPVFLDRLAELLKNDKLKELQLDNAGLRFQLDEGRLNLGDTPVRIGGGTARLRGSTGVLDKSLALALDLELPASQLQASGVAGDLLKAAAPDGRVPVTVTIGGSYDKPKLSLDASALTTSVKDAVTQAVGQVVDQVVDKAQAGVDKLIDEARKQGDKLVGEAEAASATLQAEAKKQGDKLRAEAKKQGEKLVAEAKGNPIKEAAAKEAAKKLRQEADKQATKGENEAKKAGDAAVGKAKSQREKLIADAEAKSRLR